MFFGSNEICRLKFSFFDNVSYLFFAALLFNKWCCKICGRAVVMDSLYFLHAVSESVRYPCVPTKTTTQENIIQCSEGIWKLDTARQMIMRIKRRAK